MATVIRENIGNLHDKLTVKLVKEDYMPAFEKTLKQYAKTASIPGFRKGMVPTGMLRKMAGPSLFNEEVINTAGRELQNYMRNENLAIFAQPMIIPDANQPKLDMNKPVDIDFAFEIGIKPEFELTAIKNKTQLNRYKITVTDKMLDDEMDRMSRRYGKVEDQEAVNTKDDIIYCTFEPCNAEGVVSGDKIEETALLEKMPAKLQEMLMGKKANDTLVITPAGVCTEEELTKFLKDPLKATEEAKDSHYLLTLTKVGKLIPAEMNSELFGRVFPNEEIADLDAFKAKVKEELQREYDRITRERLHNEIFELLVHSTEISLPVDFLKRWLREGGEKLKSAEEVENEFSGFEHQLRWQLISDKIVTDNNISVTREEVATDIKTRVLSYYGMAIDDEAPWMDSYVDKVMKDEKMVDETFRRILTARIFDAIEGQFNQVETAIEEEAFFKLADPHATHHHHH